jgi:putative hydrolase of the HAD superfamily
MFDALGTLVHLEPPWPALQSILLARHGIDVTEESARAAVLAEMSYYRDHHREGRDPESLADLRRRCAAVLSEHLPETASLSDSELVELLLSAIRFSPYPDAAGALARVRVLGLPAAVVSNWDCSLRSVLADLGLGGMVDAVVVSAEVGSAKPEPGIFEAALQRLGCPAETALFVGDSLDTDVAGARNAGLRAVLLDRGGAMEAPAGVERIFSLETLDELIVPASTP